MDNEILNEVLQIVKETRSDVSEVKTRVGSLETKVDSLETKVDSLGTKVDSLETKVHELEADVKSTKLIIENEVRPNIKEIAACHLDLSKKLDAVTASYESYSDLQIRVRVLESQMRELRDLRTAN